MSGREFVGLFLACADASVNILAAIKRRRGAERDIAELTTNSTFKLRFIHALMNKVDASPHSTSLLDMILHQRLEELNRVELKLKALPRHSTRDSRAKRFWKAHDIAKALDSIGADLDKLQLALENVVLQWEQRNIARPSKEEDVTHNAAIDQELCNGVQMMALNRKESAFLSSVQLSSGDLQLLAKYDSLYELSLPESLYETWWFLRDNSSEWAQRKGTQYLRISANLNFPPANSWLGQCYLDGKGVDQNYELAISHFGAGKWNPHAYVAEVYFDLGEHKNA